MRKLIVGLNFITILLAVFGIGFAGLAWADPVDINQYTKNVADQSGYGTAGVTDTTLSESIGRVIKILLSFTGVVFLALTVYAGFLWMTAGGNAEQVEKSQQIVKTATMGLIIVISCYGIVVFLLAAIGAATNTQTTTVGNVNPGSSSFWGSFGKNFKNSWWKLF